MKRIVIIRHGKAELFSPDYNDFNRKLKPTGIKKTELLAEKLLEENSRPDLIISSPAKRALKTAKVLGKKTGCQEFLLNIALYEGSYDRDWLVLDIENKIHDAKVVYIVGHNPLLWSIIKDLSGVELEHVSKSSATIIDFDIKEWSELIHRKKGMFNQYIRIDLPNDLL